MAAARKIRKIFSTLTLTRLSSTTLSSLTLIHLTLLTAFTTSCTIETNSSKQSSLAPPQIESATIENDRLIIHGTFLQNVTSVSIEGIPQSFAIESQNDLQIRAYVASALKLVAGKSYNVVVASAHAQAAAPITLQLDSLGAENGQVLQFNSVTQTWEPGDLNGLTFLGSWDASNNSPELHDGGISTNPRPGDYYIVTTEGNTLLDGIDSWVKGDWVVYRSDGMWTKIVSHGGVTSFNGRMGAIAPQSGDYALSSLSDVDTSGKTTNSVLKWDGAKWVVDTDDTVASTGVITGTQASGGSVIFHSGTGDSSTEQMRMTSTGLGIGTSSPQSRLTVEGDMTLDQLATSPTGTSGYGSIYAKTDGKLYFRDGTDTEFDLTEDATKLPLNGGTLSGDLDMGGYNILGAGHLILSPGTTINLGTYDNDSEALLTGSLGSIDKGKSWFNTTTNEIRYWDGAQAKSLGVAGSGLQSLGGQLGSTQSLAVGTTGANLTWSSASDTHTLNIPMASTAGVTAGLLSKTDYDTFSGKVNRSGDTMTGDLNMSTYKITNLGTPTVNADAATKSYVDANLGGSPLDLTGLSAGQAVKWDTTKWVPYSPTTGTVTSVTASGPLASSGGATPNITLSTVPITSGGTGAISASDARTNLGLGTAATMNAGTITGTVAYGDHAHTDYLLKSGGAMTGNITLNGNYLSGDGGNEGVYVDASGNIGVGTTAPSAKLDISNGDFIMGGTRLYPGGVNVNIFTIDPRSATPTDNEFRINSDDGGTTLSVSMEPNGKVGIGTYSPSEKLIVRGLVGVGSYDPGGGQPMGSIDADLGTTGAGDNSGRLRFNVRQGSDGTQQTKMVIDNSGNVGIGTTSPTSVLHLKAGTATAGTAPLKLTSGINLTAPESGAIEYDGTNLFYTDSTNARKTLVTTATGSFSSVTSIANSGDITLASTGAVLINSGTVSTGTTSGALVVTGGVGVSGAINVDGNATVGSLLLPQSSSGVVSSGGYYFNPNDGLGNTTIDGGRLNFKTDGIERMVIDPSTGNVGIGTASPSEKLEVNGNIKATAFLYSSDRRLKHNIMTCEGALDKIEKLRGVSFAWNEDNSEDIGFIAQEVEEVEPRLVVTNKQNGLKSVKYGNIVALLVEAMKEQNLEVARLKEENEKDINKLKNQNKLLKDFLCQKEPGLSLCLEK